MVEHHKGDKEREMENKNTRGKDFFLKVTRNNCKFKKIKVTWDEGN